jgi:hypothetical protein
MGRANFAPASKCRLGECGNCRPILLSSKVYRNAKTNLRREAEKIYNYFHPCLSYLISNLEIEVPRNQKKIYKKFKIRKIE